MTKPRILFICHNHPSLHPGGTEIFAYDLFQEVKASGAAEALFLACTDRLHREQKPGTAFQTVGRSADELILWTGHYDRFFMSQNDLHGIVPELTMLLQSFKPDVVHFHHSLLIGVEMLQLVKRVLPQARIVFTLHDYYMICANDGQMVKPRTHELCRQASPDACHKCFPEIGGDQFVLRTKHIQNMLDAVDRFIAPSEFLRTRYVAWGLNPDKIDVLRNGRPAVHAQPPREIAAEGKRNSFAYFGNLSPYKGVMVAIEAARLLSEAGRSDFSLAIHGGAPFQSDRFRDGFAKAVADNARSVTHRGPYSVDEMSGLMRGADWVIVPSIWWENAPLVIQEALQQRRPVICSNIGGMAEAVRDGVDGLHFRAGDASDLARVMAMAMDTPGLWDKLAGQIGLVRTVAESAAEHATLYQSLMRAQVPA